MKKQSDFSEYAGIYCAVQHDGKESGEMRIDMKQFKRILAILAVVIIAGLYIATLVCAIFVKRFSGQMFLACIVATVMVPLLLYLLFWLYDLLQSRNGREENREEKNRKGFAAAAAFNQGKKFAGAETKKLEQEDIATDNNDVTEQIEE